MKNCWLCESTEDLGEYANLFDFDPLRDTEPPSILLCAACVGPEPTACSEHRSGGCEQGEHVLLGEAE